MIQQVGGRVLPSNEGFVIGCFAILSAVRQGRQPKRGWPDGGRSVRFLLLMAVAPL